MEVSHFIAEENARVGSDDSGTQKVSKRLRESNHIIFPVDYAEMRGVFVSRLIEIASPRNWNCGIQMNQLAALGRVRFREESLNGNLLGAELWHLSTLSVWQSGS